MAEEEVGTKDLGELIRLIRWVRGWSQAKLARRTGIGRAQINRYESGKDKPRPATFRQILSEAGVPLGLLDFLQWCLQLIRKALAMGSTVAAPAGDGSASRLETRNAVWSAVDRVLSLARAELALLRSLPVPGWQSLPTEQHIRQADALLERLASYPEGKQRLLVEGAPTFRDWVLCQRACVASERAAADRPGEALKLAELALFVAQHVPGTDAWRLRLQGHCTGFIANAQRVGSDLRLAEATFARACRLWRDGEDEAGLLSEAHLLDMEASLRRAQRLFPKALKLHDLALKIARPEEIGFILLNMSATLEQKGDSEASIEVLEEAAKVIDGERQPRLRFGLRFNHAANLSRLGRAREAAEIVPEVRELAERLRNDLDLVRTLWLEGNVAAGLGRRESAVTNLEQVRRAFEDRKLPYDYALASLDAALLYREEGRYAEIQALAQEILKIFQAQEVQREAVAAVILFQEAADQERVTAGLVRRLQDFLSKARSNPKLRFKE